MGFFLKTKLIILASLYFKGVRMKLLTLTIFICFLSYTSTVFAHPKLTILSRAYINDDIDRTSDKNFYTFFQQILASEFDLSFQWTNNARLIRRLSSSEAVCSYNLIKTKERETQFLFSAIPSTLHVQRKLFAFKSTLKDLPQIVSVSKLLAENKTFGIVGSTSYKELDPIFAHYPNQVVAVNSTNSFAQLGRLLTHKRIDMIVDYDFTLKSFLTNEEYDQLDSRKISEYPEFIRGYFSCSRTEEGKKAIEMINNYIKMPQMYDFLKKNHYTLFDQATAKRIMQVYKNEFNLVEETPND